MYSDDPLNEELVPFGYYGPLKYNDFEVNITTNKDGNFGSNIFVLGANQFLDSTKIPDATTLVITGTGVGGGGTQGPHLTFLFPTHELRLSGTQDGLSDQTDAYWGVWTGISKASNKFNRDYADLNRNKSDILSSQLNKTDSTNYQFIFTLDEVTGSSTGTLALVSG